MKNNFKKTLAVAGILASLFATSAFAAEEQAAPTMKERVASILCDGQGNCNDQQLKRPRFRHSPEEFKRNAPRHGRVSMLTPEQREELHKARLEMIEKLKTMTPEEQKAAHAEFRKKVEAQVMKNMTPEQKAQYQKRLAAQAAEREKIKAMTPEQREAYFAKKHKQMIEERTKNMSAAEKKAFLEHDEKMQKERAERREKMANMTEAEREKYRQAKREQAPMQGRGYKGHRPLIMGPGPVMPSAPDKAE